MKSLVKIMVMVLGVLATSSCRTGLLPTTVNSGGGGSILASLPALPSDVQSSGKYVLSCDKIIPIEAMASQQTCAGESSQCQVTFTVPQDVTLQEGQECKVGVWAKVDIKKYVYAVAERSGDLRLYYSSIKSPLAKQGTDFVLKVQMFKLHSDSGTFHSEILFQAYEEGSTKVSPGSEAGAIASGKNMDLKGLVAANLHCRVDGINETIATTNVRKDSTGIEHLIFPITEELFAGTSSISCKTADLILNNNGVDEYYSGDVLGGNEFSKADTTTKSRAAEFIKVKTGSSGGGSVDVRAENIIDTLDGAQYASLGGCSGGVDASGYLEFEKTFGGAANQLTISYNLEDCKKTLADGAGKTIGGMYDATIMYRESERLNAANSFVFELRISSSVKMYTVMKFNANGTIQFATPLDSPFDDETPGYLKWTGTNDISKLSQLTISQQIFQKK